MAFRTSSKMELLTRIVNSWKEYCDKRIHVRLDSVPECNEDFLCNEASLTGLLNDHDLKKPVALSTVF